MSAFGRFLPIEAVRRMSALGEWPLKCTTLIQWLYHRHALKAFRASVGDVESDMKPPWKKDGYLVNVTGFVSCGPPYVILTAGIV